MEFTEVKEINEMIQHSKSFHTSSNTELHRNPYTRATQDTMNVVHEEINEEFCDYDQALQDSPRATNLKHDPLETLSDTLKLGEEEPLEDIILDITTTIKDITQEGLLEIEKLKKEVINSAKMLELDGEIAEHPNESDSDSEMDNQKKDAGGDNPKNSDRQTAGQADQKGILAKSAGFEKLPTEMIINQSQLKRSILSQTMKEQPRKHNAFVPGSGVRGGNKPILKEFKVYFWKTSLCLNIPLNISATVSEVIRQIIESYMNSSSVDQSLMKYPKFTEAYELRMLENDDDYKPEMAFGALEKQKPFHEYNIQKGVAFVEVSNFKPPQEEDERDNQSKYDKMENLVKLKNVQINFKMLVHVHAVEEKFKSSLQVDPEEPIKALFPKVSAKLKNISAKTHQLKIFQSDPELRLLEKGNFLDINMPIKNLKLNKTGGLELEVVKRKFADDPADVPGTTKRHQSKAAELSHQLAQSLPDATSETDDNVFLYNDVSASHYEEFEVIKINPRGKKQTRVIGIDGFKIYNMSKKYKEQNMGLSGIFSTVFFSKFSTKHPERLLKDIKDARVKKDNLFCIEVKAENSRTKTIEYEAPDKKTAQQIVAKIRYIKTLEQKNH